MNLTTSLYSGGGVIHSPNYPHKYPLNTTCEYHIRSQLPGGRILLNFESFVMEGNQDSKYFLCCRAKPKGSIRSVYK